MSLDYSADYLRILTKQLKHIDFTTRTHNAFLANGYTYLAEILEKSEGELKRIPNLGIKSITEIKSYIKKIPGFKLNMNMSEVLKYFGVGGFKELKILLDKVEIHEFDSLNETVIEKAHNLSIPSISYKTNKNLLTKLEEFEFSVRTTNYFLNEGIIYIGDLAQKYVTDILRSQNTGVKSLKEIEDFLGTKGLSLEMDLTDWPPENVESLNKELIKIQDPLSAQWKLDEPDFNIIEKTIIQDMQNFFAKLKDKEELIFKKRLGIENYIQTLEELGEIFNVTRERIRQIEKKVTLKLKKNCSIDSDTLKKFLVKHQNKGFVKIFPNLNKFFYTSNRGIKSKSENNNSLIYFLEIYTDVKKNFYETPEQAAHTFSINFSRITEIFKDLIFPISREDLSYEISNTFGIEYSTVFNSIDYLVSNNIFIKVENNEYYPFKISKKNEILSILNRYPNGIHYKDLFSIINASPSRTTIRNIHSNFAVGALDISEYIYFGSGIIKSIKFSNFDMIKKNHLLELMEEFLKNNHNFSNLKTVFDFFSNELPKEVDIYDFRYFVKNFGEDKGIYFSGKSQAQSISLGKKIRLNHQEELHFQINNSKDPLHINELEKNFSGVKVLLRVHLSEIVSQGLVCRYDIDEWCNNDYAYKNIDLENVRINLLQIIQSKKYTTLSYLVEEFQDTLSIFENIYFIESLIKKIIVDYHLDYFLFSGLISHKNDSNKKLNEILSDKIDKNIDLDLNYETLISDINIKYNEFKKYFQNLRYYSNQ